MAKLSNAEWFLLGLIGLGGAALTISVVGRAAGPGIRLIIEVDATYAGDDAMANAVLTSGKVGIANKTVAITITNPDGMRTTTNAVTDADGAFSIIFVPSIAGTYIIAGVFAGDATYPPASASIDFTVKPKPIIPMLEVNTGGGMFAGDEPFLTNGLNETMMVAYDCYARGGNSGYKFGNMNFPNNINPSTNVHWSPAPTSNKQFGYEYFWICKSLGINVVRLGASAATESNNIYHSWHTDHDYFVQYLSDMLDMAAENGVYIFFNFGSPIWHSGGVTVPASFDTTTSHVVAAGTAGALAGDCLTVGSAAWDEYVAWMGAMMQQFEGHPALGAWDIANEPDANGAYAAYWLPKYGTQAAAQQAYAAWAQATHDAVKAYTTHIVYIGTGGGNFFHHTEAEFALRNTGSEIYGVHAYGSAEGAGAEYDDFQMPHIWATRLGKPNVNTEVGYTAPSSPWCTGYWPWYASKAPTYHIGIIWMQLNAPGKAGCPLNTKPAYPGYPLTQAQMDAALAAWIAFSTGH